MADRSIQLGMRRLSWVQVVVDGETSRAEVHGLGHRLPCVRQVSLITAAELAAEGLPVVVSRADRRAEVH